ncbi:TolC family protein [Marinomonas ostreistagni]|uniref:TolC family protein n=1 Tax=Marinomonas ostreistagni TaxID=359209 RepID=UPI001950D2BC|nr:TolC family protein [Marinomonas ostreistagni]MBM6550351.1 TolC family protein [Marinomonas ostreistagni]
MFFIPMSARRMTGALTMALLASTANAEELTLAQAVQASLKQDAWLVANQKQQQAAIALSEGATALPDPKITLGLLNMPTDSFDFEQEAMTQLSLQVTQMLPVGDTLEINRQQHRVSAQQAVWQRQNRVALIKKQVTQLWLKAYQAQQALRIVEQSRPLFEQLNDAVAGHYRASYGATRQQDLVRAELELGKLEQRLMTLKQSRDEALSQLKQYLPEQAAEEMTLPQERLAQPDTSMQAMQTVDLNKQLAQHPLVKLMDERTHGARLEQSLEEQKYKPQFGVSLGYGYRGEAPNGDDRADLASLAVSVSMPIFSSKRQDAAVLAARLQAESLLSDKTLLLNELQSRYQVINSNWQQLQQREAQYQTQLLPQYQASSEAALNAYTRDDGPFVDIVQARIAELNARVELLNIQVAQHQQAAELNYLLTSSEGAQS